MFLSNYYYYYYFAVIVFECTTHSFAQKNSPNNEMRVCLIQRDIAIPQSMSECSHNYVHHNALIVVWCYLNKLALFMVYYS